MENEKNVIEEEPIVSEESAETESTEAQKNVLALKEKNAKIKKRNLGIAATVGTIALGAIAVVALKLFRHK